MIYRESFQFSNIKNNNENSASDFAGESPKDIASGFTIPGSKT